MFNESQAHRPAVSHSSPSYCQVRLPFGTSESEMRRVEGPTSGHCEDRPPCRRPLPAQRAARLASCQRGSQCGLPLWEQGVHVRRHPALSPSVHLSPTDYRNLTFDPDSANRHLYLSRQDQQVKHCLKPRGLAGPGSFELWQVQCAQSFQSGRHYWEVRTSSHSVTLGVAYPELTRRKQGAHTDNIGRGPHSWGLCIQEEGAQAWHNGEARRLPAVSGKLLGVDLDLVSGCLTFYSLEPEAQLLHTFHAIFTRPLYPIFWLLEGRTLTLCHRPEAKPHPGLQEEASGLS